MPTILITILATLTAVAMIVATSALMERRRLHWREVASERRRKEDARIAAYRAQNSAMTGAR